MKYIPLQGQLCKLNGNHTLTERTPVNYMKYITLHGHPWKLYEIHSLTGTIM